MSTMVKSNLKVLFITHYSDFYGANLSMINLTLDLINVEPFILTPLSGKLTDYLDENNINYLITKFFGWEISRTIFLYKLYRKYSNLY